jgi:hypothetical protein
MAQLAMDEKVMSQLQKPDLKGRYAPTGIG